MNENPEQDEARQAAASNEVVGSQNEALQGLAANAGAVILDIARADSKAKDYAAKRIIDAINDGNVDIITTDSVIGMPEPLVNAKSVPKGAFVDGDAFVPEEAEFETTFSIETHEEESLAIGSDVSVEANVQVGWGPVSAGVKTTASVSVDKENKRSKDQRATVSLRVKMKQKPAPEIFNRIIDQQLKTSDKIADINNEIIDARIQMMRQQGGVQELTTDEGQQKMLSGSEPEPEETDD